MNKKHFIFLGFLFIRLAFSQTPDEYFHSAAFNYIEKQIPAALADIETGLKLDPSNKKLHQLLEKIKQEQKQQQQKSQQNQQSDNKKDDQQKKDQNKEQREKKEQKEDKSSSDQQKKSDEKEAEKQKQEKENQSKKEEKQKGEKDKAPPASENDKKVKQISREAALQILKALENEEKNGKIKQRPVRSKGEKREHDW